jgi:anti-sigma regulatory factor (Ser/Thr protein kinase)
VFCAIIDMASATVSYSSAGHPPPVLATPSGEGRLLDQAQSVPLAVLPDPRPRPGASVPLTPGATLLLYTDGLVERRNQPLDDGLAALIGFIVRNGELHPEQLADQLMAELAPPAGFDDDVAVLAYRHPPAPLHLRLPATPTSLAEIRTRLRHWLPAAAIGQDTAADVQLAVGEAAANAIEHSPAPGRESTVRLDVTARIAENRLVLTVSDTGSWRPPPSDPGHRGHGITLMRALMTDVVITASERGTTVEMTKELHA